MNNPIIYFISPGTQNLPDINAYLDYCKKLKIEAYAVNSNYDFKGESRKNIIKWYFMGFYPNFNKNDFVVYEYLSLSTGKFTLIKDFIKRTLSIRANVCIYLNEYVKKKLSFSSMTTSYAIRDMGVSNLFINFEQNDDRHTQCEFDFVYCGSLAKDRKIEKLLTLFTNGIFQDFSLLVIGRTEPEMVKEFASENISFIGKIDYRDVPCALKRARCAINYIPDKQPFNKQTSTKLIEYLAMKMPVLSTKYDWVCDFVKENSAPVYFMNFDKDFDKDFDFLDFKRFLSAKHKFPDMKKYDWDYIIEESNVFDVVLSEFQKFK